MHGRWWPGGLVRRMEELPLPLQPRESNNARPRSQAARARHRFPPYGGWSPAALVYSRRNPVGLSGAQSAPDVISVSGRRSSSGRTNPKSATGAKPMGFAYACRRPAGARCSRHGVARVAAVRETGSEARSGVVRVRAVRGEDAASRVAFAVPGAGGAVRRNRARRRLRAAIAPLLLDCPRLDLVVSLPGSATETPFADLRAALATALGSVQTRIPT
jgi:ribonuclease P protein component